MAYDAYDARYDRPAGFPPVKVRRSLLLCSSPRSGSTLLADTLHQTGRLGCPTEYFDRTAAFAACYERWGATDMVSYVAALHRFRTTDDGLLSAKIHWFQLQWLSRELEPGLTVDRGSETSGGETSGETAGYGVGDGDGVGDGEDDPDGRPTGADRAEPSSERPEGTAVERAALDFVFPGCRYVRVTRRDRDRQAVSWAVADQLNRWSSDDPRSTKTIADFVYDFDTVDRFRRRLDEDEARWDELLAAMGVDVLTVVYEDLLRSYPEAVAAVAAHAGVTLAPDEVPPPRLARQSNERSEQILALYRRDRERRHGRPPA